MKKYYFRMTALLLALLLCTGCGLVDYLTGQTLPDPPDLLWLMPYGELKAAVLYSSGQESADWEDTFALLSQSTLANLEITAVDVEEPLPKLTDFTVLYPAPSLLDSPDWPSVQEKLIDYTRQGGALFLAHGFASHFDLAFLGVEALLPLTGEAVKPVYPEASQDAAPLQQIVKDAFGLQALFAGKSSSLAGQGVGATVSTATSLASSGKVSLCTLNRVGEGFVLLSPALLSRSALPIDAAGENGSGSDAFSASLSHLNRLFLDGFAAYVAREKYGFSLERVFGSYGRPGMSWTLPIQEISQLKDDTVTTFGDLCIENLQIPSYSLARSLYSPQRRVESISYLLNQGEEGSFTFANDLRETAYSTGLHVVADGQWMTLEDADEPEGSAPSSPPAMTAYPWISDLNGDGYPDILTGSSDGYFYFFAGKPEAAERFSVKHEDTLASPRINALRINGISTPVLCHLDQDGYPDLLSGTGNGTVVWYSGTSTMDFLPRGTLLNTGFGYCQTFPSMGDVTGDGVPDLVVGTNDGRLRLFYGIKTPAGLSFTTSASTDLTDSVAGLGSWIAPRLIDLNGDGVPEIVIGTGEGYIARLTRNGRQWQQDGYLKGTVLNRAGDYRLQFGYNAVPLFADVNGDGQPDLVVGSLEEAITYPIDSPWFPAIEELSAHADYVRQNSLYLGVHALTAGHSDPWADRVELELHREAFAGYGLSFDGLGASIQNSGPSIEALRPQYEQGMLWSTGLIPREESGQLAYESTLHVPSFVLDNGQRTALLLPMSQLAGGDGSPEHIAARYHMPLSLYMPSWRSAEDQAIQVAAAGRFQETYHYSFMREDQLFKSIYAAFNTRVSAYQLIDEDSSETEPHTLALAARPLEGADRHGLYDKAYQSALGVCITLSDRYNGIELQTDADVWYREGNRLYVALNKDVRIYPAAEADSPAHLVGVNLPADITRTKKGVQLSFLEDGMMQVLVEGTCTSTSKGWIRTEKDGYTQYTRFGMAASLELEY